MRTGLGWMLVGLALVWCGMAGRGLHAAETDWYAGAPVLVERIERLATAGELSAAESVLAALITREKSEEGYVGRARFALAKAYLAVGDAPKALALAEQITWADADPTVAGEVVALRLAIHWRGLQDRAGVLRSGMVPAVEVVGSMTALSDRRDHLAAFEELLGGGLRMVSAEGHPVTLPATQAWIDLARWAHGTQDQVPAAIADSDWKLALGRLHLEEHEVPAAVTVAEGLIAQPKLALPLVRDLRCWQLRREAMRGVIDLWDEPGLDSRITALVTLVPDAEVAAQQRIAAETDLNRAGTAQAIRRVMQLEMSTEEVADVVADLAVEDHFEEVEILEPDDETTMLALDHEDLRIRGGGEEHLPGRPVDFTVVTAYRGPHSAAVWRVQDEGSWRDLAAHPQRETLGAAPVATVTLDVPTNQLPGATQRVPLRFAALPEGLYAVTMSARGSPVMALTTFVVNGLDIQVITHREGGVVWVVERKSGRSCAKEPVVIDWSRSPDPQRIAGDAWDAHDEAWQAGFRSAFLGNTFTGRISETDRAMFDAGSTAGAKAAESTERVRQVNVITNGTGIVEIAVPAGWEQDPWSVTAAVSRGGARSASTATQQAAALWSQRTVAWADRSFARPGETLRFHALMRRSDGDRWDLPSGPIAMRVVMHADGASSDEVIELLRSTATLADDGSLSGSVVIPPDCGSGKINLVLEPGGKHHLCDLQRAGLPSLTLDFSGPLDDATRAGETAHLTGVLRDAHGQGLAGISVEPRIRARDAVDGFPVQAGSVLTDDEGRFTIDVITVADRLATYDCSVSVIVNRRSEVRSTSFRTRLFPFVCTVNIPDRTVSAGGDLGFSLTLPEGASVWAGLIANGAMVGERRRVDGVGERAVPLRLVIPSGLTSSKLAVQIRADTLDGKGVEVTYPLTLIAPTAQQAAVDVMCDRYRIDPNETVRLAVTCEQPGRDVLLTAGAHVISHAEIVRTTDVATQRQLTADATWVPDIYLRACAWLPGRGFVTSPARTIHVRPIDRLLRVVANSDVDDWQPGSVATVRLHVSNWQGAAVAGARLVVGIVDERLYQLAEDETPDLWRYFHDYSREERSEIGRPVAMSIAETYAWRSVIRRHGDMFGSRSSGGKRRAIGRGGGHRASERASTADPFLSIDEDPVIWWSEALISAADGSCSVTVTLPNHPGRWRLTARVNDASPAILVGEVRHQLQASAGLHVSAELPAAASPNDRVELVVKLHQRIATERRVRISIGDQQVERVLAGNSRNQVPVPYVVVAGNGELIERDGVLGRIVTEMITVTDLDSDESVTTRVQIFVRLPGLAQTWTLQGVVDPDGNFALPTTVQPGAWVRVVVRAWPDAPTRAHGWLHERRAGSGTIPEQVLAWLLADEGKLRTEAIARLWPQLGDSDAANYVRHIAVQRGFLSSLSSPASWSEIGKWLRARSMRLGGGRLSARISGTSLIALAARRLQDYDRATWESANRSGSDPMRLAILADTARIVGDADAEVLARRLGALAWNDPLVAVIAANLLSGLPVDPEVSPVTIVDGAQRQELPSGAWQTWMGSIQTGLHVRGRPGAPLMCTLMVQQAPTLPDLAVTWRQLSDDGVWWPANPHALRPGRQTVAVIAELDSFASNQLEVLLPPVLTGEEVTAGEDAIELRRSLVTNAFMQERLRSALVTGQAAMVLRDELPVWPLRDDAIGGLIEVKNPEELGDSGLRATWKCNRSKLMIGFRTATAGNGQCQIQVQNDYGQVSGVHEVNVVIAEDGPVGESQPPWGHPLAKRIAALLDHADEREANWLVGHMLSTNELDQQRSWIDILDAEASQPVLALTEHPHAGEPGHWTTKRFAEWRANPLPARLFTALKEVVNPEACTLATLGDIRENILVTRHAIDACLTEPAPTMQIPTLRQIAEAGQHNGFLPAGALSPWFWQQDLPVDLVRQLGGGGLDGWCRFLREECGLAVQLPANCPVAPVVVGMLIDDQHFVHGERLGRDHLAQSGFTVSAIQTGWQVESSQVLSQAGACVDIDWNDRPLTEVITLLDMWSQNRGLGPIHCFANDARDRKITFRGSFTVPDILRWVAMMEGGRIETNAEGTLLTW